jgi:hypothetical protein
LIQLHQALKEGRKIKDTSKENEVNMSSDPFFDLARGIRGDLNKASHHFGRMAEAMEKEAKAQEEATQKDQMQVLQENSIAELTRLGFTGSELLQAARCFCKGPESDDDAFCAFRDSHERIHREYDCG